MAELLSLIDGNSLIHRAYHALPPLTTSKGELTNAVYGFSTMLLKVLEELKPTMMAVAFDLAAPTFRHKAFQAYKAQRQKTAEGLAAQFERTREVVRAFAFPIYEVEGFEADDVIGSLAHQADLHGIDTVIVTGDLDALQLVGPRVRVLTTRRGITDTMLYDEGAVQERYGLSATQIVDYKAIVGDVSDNIPGLPGIGEKTAARLLQQFGSLDNIYENLALVPQKVASTLEQGRQQAFLNRQLAAIVINVDVTLDTEACRVGREDRRKLVALFRELEFKSLLARLSPEAGVKAESQGALWATPQATSPATKPGASGDMRRIALDNEEALNELAERLRRQEAFSLVAIIDDTNVMRSQLVGLATAWGPDEGHYIPIGHQAGQQVALAAVQRALGPLLGDPAVRKHTHHGKLATIALSQQGIPLDGIVFDSMIAAYLLESTQRTSALPDLAATRLGLEVPSLEALVGRGKGQISPSALPVEQLAPLAVAHAEAIWRLAEPMADDLKAAGLWNLFVDIELPLIGVLAKMEQAGMAVDLRLLQTISSELYEKIVALERQIYEHVGHQFNINSPQQLAGVLFQELGLPGGKRTKTGWSTDATVLEELRGAHPIIELILEYRQWVKLKSTYVDALPLLINPTTGRLHTSFNQTGAATGRLSSSDPNLQNIPIRTEEGKRIRTAFVAGQPDLMLLGADYSQIELRLLAHYSQDARLLEAFHAGEDIHAATASDLFGVPREAVDSNMRRVAKTVNFGIIYGISEYGLAARAILPRQEAAQYINDYLNRYEGVRRYVEETKRQAAQLGYVTTLLGRRRYLPEIRAPHHALRAAAERAAINAPLQGTAADLMKLAMVQVDHAMRQQGLRSRMILQVHDELLFEVPKDEVEALQNLVRNVMESVYPLAVPLKVDIKVGRNWGELD